MKFKTITNAKKETQLSYLGKINNSSKLMKNGKISHQYTYAIYLAPANTSGYNVCSHSTPECRMGCLATSGRAKIELLSCITTIQKHRIKKTKLLFEHPDYFMGWLIAEISKYYTKAKKDNYGFSVRLNCTSDIDWTSIKYMGQNIFEIFSDIQFYDYTKNPNKFNNIPSNYHLTFSYTGRNWEQCEKLLNLGYNVAVVFNIKNSKQLPKSFMGYDVINGDETDYRVADKKGVIIGLMFKKIANKEAQKKVLNSCFVVSNKNIEQTKTTSNNVKTSMSISK